MLQHVCRRPDASSNLVSCSKFTEPLRVVRRGGFVRLTVAVRISNISWLFLPPVSCSYVN